MKRIRKFVHAAVFAAAAIPFFSGCALGDALLSIGEVFIEDTGIDDVVNVVQSVAKLAEDISAEDAYYIGRSVAANILTNYDVYSDKALEKYLNKICQTLVINSSDPSPYNGYHVKVLDAINEVNAYSTPGGHILITTGLIDCADTEDALAAVIAHEIGHIQLKHSLGSIKASRFKDTMDAVDQMFSDDEMDDVSDDIISSMMGSGFSQGQEYDADEKAIELMKNAGYQPSAMIDMLEQMKAHERMSSNKGFFKTHPSPSSRISNIKSFVRNAEKNLENTMEYREDRYDRVMY